MISKMNVGNNVTVEVLVKICKALSCTLDDIMEFIPKNGEMEGEAND